MDQVRFATIAAFIAASVGAGALWWIYFDRSAGDAADLTDACDDPGRLGRSAHHVIHPVMVAGIIVLAPADESVLEDPTGRAGSSTVWLVLGGTALLSAATRCSRLSSGG